jgi:hypothetical protein
MRLVSLLIETAGAAVILAAGLMAYCFGEEILKMIFN